MQQHKAWFSESYHPAHHTAEFEENLVLHVQVVGLAKDTLVIRDLKTPSCVLVDSTF
jgi:hypothetical protein